MTDDHLLDRWPLTRAAIEAGEPEPLGDGTDDEAEDDLRFGRSLLGALAMDSDGALREIRPGMFMISKFEHRPPPIG